MWKCSNNGEFNTNSAYRLTIQGEENAVQFSGQWVWKLAMLPKIIYFIWLCLHGSIPIREVLAGRGINCVKLCPICKEQDESILHLLRDCVYARDLWRKLEVPPTLVSSFTEGFETWLKTNYLSGMKHKGITPWCTLFIFTLWSLWNNRNHVVFENTIPNPRLDKVCLSQAKDYYYCINKAKQITPKIAIPVRWSKPILGWFKFNTDGASLGNPGKAGSGGLIKDNERRWVRGFSRSVGHATSVIAELWALKDGLELVAQLGIGCLEVELDAKIIVEIPFQIQGLIRFA